MSDKTDFQKWFSGYVPEYDGQQNVGSMEDIAKPAWDAAIKSRDEENAALVKRWDVLKWCIESMTGIDQQHSHGITYYQNVLDKMQELEDV